MIDTFVDPEDKADFMIKDYIKRNNPLSKIMIDCLMYYRKSGYYRDVVCKHVIEREFDRLWTFGIQIDNRCLIRRYLENITR